MVGLAVGLSTVVELNAVAGLQLYVNGKVLPPPPVPVQLATKTVVCVQGGTTPELIELPLQEIEKLTVLSQIVP